MCLHRSTKYCFLKSLIHLPSLGNCKLCIFYSLYCLSLFRSWAEKTAISSTTIQEKQGIFNTGTFLVQIHFLPLPETLCYICAFRTVDNGQSSATKWCYITKYISNNTSSFLIMTLRIKFIHVLQNNLLLQVNNIFFLWSATTYVRFWLAQPFSSNCLYPVLFLPIAYIHTPYIFQNVTFPTCFRSSNWPFRHGFLSLNLLDINILGHAFNMA